MPAKHRKHAVSPTTKGKRRRVGAVEKAKRLRTLRKQGTITRGTAVKWFFGK